MTRIELINDGVQVDASILAEAFAISADDLRLGMRDGAITSRFEQGEGDDAGKVRLTFFSANRWVRVIADELGSIVACSAIQFRTPFPSSPTAPNRGQGAGPCESGGSAVDQASADDHVAEELDAARRARLDALLDEALCETFPASDPVAISFSTGR